MLILGRKINERIFVRIGDVRFWIMITDIRPASVRLGFDAPQEVVVEREEVCREKRYGARGGNGR